MTFTNAGATVLLRSIDFFQWPCISGEDFPPTFTAGGGTVAYSDLNGWPSVSISSAFAASLVTWPRIPIYSPRTRTFLGFTVSASFFLNTATNGVGFTLTDSSSGNNWNVNVVRVSATTATATFTVGGFGFPAYTFTDNATAWHTVTMSFSASQAVSGTIDGVAAFTPRAATVAAYAQIPQFFLIPNGTTPAMHLTNLAISYP